MDSVRAVLGQCFASHLLLLFLGGLGNSFWAVFGQYRSILGSIWGSICPIEQCRNAFSADLKMPLNLLLLFFGEEKIIIIIVRPRRNISQRSPSTSLSHSSFSPACCHPRSGTSQGVSCQYRFP